jgi:hypothetical protein
LVGAGVKEVESDTTNGEELAATEKADTTKKDADLLIR